MVTVTNSDSLLLTWDQAWKLLELPSLERRVARDLKDALNIASSHRTGALGQPVPAGRIYFLLRKDKELLEAGKPCVEFVLAND